MTPTIKLCIPVLYGLQSYWPPPAHGSNVGYLEPQRESINKVTADGKVG
jgi:hypothetical protein